jgi:hypothetical protein
MTANGNRKNDEVCALTLPSDPSAPVSVNSPHQAELPTPH